MDINLLTVEAFQSEGKGGGGKLRYNIIIAPTVSKGKEIDSV